MLHDEDERHEQALMASLETRTEFERDQFRLYDQRRSEYESQATAITAAGLTMAALLVAAQEKLSDLGEVVRYGTAIAIFALVGSIICALLARFSSWLTPKELGRADPPLHVAVQTSLDAFRAVNNDTPQIELRALAHDHWKARAVSAWRLGDFKRHWLKCSAYLLVAPLLFLILVAVALLM